MTDGPSTVFVVDDDEAIRNGLSMLLRSYGYRPEVFRSGAAFLARCGEPLPERCMAILDLSMPDMNGLELQTELLRRRINIPIVFLSGEGDIPAAVDAVQHGAVDFVEKPVDTELLMNRIEEALRHRSFSSENDNIDRTRIESLTPREREVLERIIEGETSKVIAGSLGISERTVELHRSRILSKMGVRNTTELLNQIMPLLGPRKDSR